MVGSIVLKFRWTSHLRLSAALILSLCTFGSAVGESFNSTFVSVGTPFEGHWDKFGYSHPGQHHRVECNPVTMGRFNNKQTLCYGSKGTVISGGDWSVDYYVHDTSSVTPVDFIAEAGGGALSSQVWAVYPTCSGGDAGKTVFVDLYVDGRWQGWASYGHLNIGNPDNPYVEPGEWIVPGTVLGELKKWDEVPGCWSVSSDEGVHTHIEMWSKEYSSCYESHQSGTPSVPNPFLPIGALLGIVGRTVYTGFSVPCS